MRIFIVYTLCMFKQPISIVQVKKSVIKYDKIRENFIKKYEFD